jgi:dTDP-4-amino-4,6-dideoxygalactose transaminase
VSEKNFPNAENYYSRAISIPLYPDLSFSDQQKVVAAITSSIANYL